MNNQLSTVERRTLRQLEATVDRGMATFVEVGAALKEIRDGKLYREHYKTFEGYVEDKWNFKKRRAYDLIESAEVVQNVQNSAQKPIRNTSQATELAKAPPEEQAEVWNEVTESTDKPTAKDVKAAVEKRKAPVVQAEIVNDDEPTTKSEAELAVENASVGKEIINAINTAIRGLKNLPEIPGTELLISRHGAIERDLQLAKGGVQLATPHAVCPRCNGDRCQQCGNHGWVNAKLFSDLTS